MKLEKSTEIIPFLIAFFWFAFVAVNVNQLLGLIYLIVFTTGSMIIYHWDMIKTTPLDRSGKWFIPFVQGIFLYVVFVVFATILIPIFQKVPIGNLIQLIGTTTPALASSNLLNTITFVIFVPFVETIFFVIIMDFLASRWRIDISKSGLFRFKTIALVLAMSFIFLMFHITAKGITNNVALLLVFLMMFVSLMATIWFGESKQAIFFHMIANAFGVGLLASLTGVVNLSILPFIIANFIPLIIISKFKRLNTLTKLKIRRKNE